MVYKDLVSIIVPIYNVEKYLDDCMQSLLAQTYHDIEILAIDDGSPDLSGNIIDKYAERDSRIKVFHTANKGVSAARNLGLDQASGEYICFVDGDDALLSNAIEILHGIISEKNIPFVRCDYKRIKEEVFGEYSQCADFSGKTEKRDSFNLMKELMQSKQGSYIWNGIYNHYMFHDLRFLEGYKFEDTPFLAEILARGKEYIYITSVLYLYRIREGSTTFSRMDRAYLEHITAEIIRLDILKSHFPELYELGYSQMMTNVISAQLYILESGFPDKQAYQKELKNVTDKYKISFSCIMDQYVPVKRKLLLLSAKLLGIKAAAIMKKQFMY